MTSRNPSFSALYRRLGSPRGRTSPKRAWCAALVLMGVLAMIPQGTAAQDRLVLRTGAALEGEIKSAKRGEISFDTEELDVVSVDLDDVALLASPSRFEVTLDNGTFFLGTLVEADTGQVTVVGEAGSITVDLGAIVSILSIGRGFWARTNGFVDVGANVAQANSLSSFRAGGLFAYRGPKWGFSVGSDAYWQRQEATDDAGETFEQTTNRATVNTTGSRFLGTRWAVQASGDVEHNEELDLDSRVQFGLQGLYDFIENQAVEWRAGAGVVNNTENYVDEPTTTSAEIIAGSSLDIFDMGDIDLYTSVVTFTNLRDTGRFRVNIDGRISWEIISDFFIGFTVVERLDNRPPVEGAKKRDFQYGLTLGWSWS